ncbi:MAG TPA: TonB family protein [Thermoanaerobaculia bacterium]|nr:TonB family protein [Thermoanaerobaculia bacterium]
MSSTAPSIRPFGPYLLLRTTGADALGTVYRAGTLGQPRLKPFVHLRVFDGAAVDRPALLRAMEVTVDVLEGIRGPSVAGGAVLGAVDDVPFAGVEDLPGQTLEVLLAPRAAGAGLPPEHALLVTERILAALEAARPVELVAGAPHGFLVPSFVHISYDGEIRVFGFGLGSGLLPALRFPKARPPFAPYIAPEVLESGQPTTAGDAYSVAAILHEALTGRPPVPGAAAAGVDGATLAADGAPVPDPVRELLRRGLAADPARREKDLTTFRKAVNTLLYGGPFTASTFNLAFFVQQQFERTIQAEKREREAEETLGAPRPPSSPARPVLAPPPTAPPVRPPAPRGRSVDDSAATRPAPAVRRLPSRTVADAQKKSPLGGVPIWAVAAAAVVVLVAAGFLATKLRLGAGPPPTPVPVPTAVPTPPAPPTPVVVGKEDPLFQAAVQARLQEELKKRERERQLEQQKEQKKRQADVDRAAEEARKAKEAEEALRAARDRNDREEALRLAKEAQEARRRADEAAAAARAAASPAVKEGDLVDIAQVDTEPEVVTSVKPVVPQLARMRKVGGTVLLRVLVNEKGQTGAVEILRDTSPRVGLAESSKAAVERWTWKPATKDGRNVRTWTTVPVPFVVQ